MPPENPLNKRINAHLARALTAIQLAARHVGMRSKLVYIRMTKKEISAAEDITKDQVK